MMKNILDRDEILAAYAEGELPDRERAQIDARLAESEAMRRSLKEILRTQELLKNIPEVETPAGFADGVMRRIREEAAIVNPGFFERVIAAFQPKFAAQAIAALMIVLSIAVYQAYNPAPDTVRSTGGVIGGSDAGEEPWGDVEITLAVSDMERAEAEVLRIVRNSGGVLIKKQQLGESKNILFVVIDSAQANKLGDSLGAVGKLEQKGAIGGGDVKAKIRIVVGE